MRASADTGHPHVRWWAVMQWTPAVAVVCCTSQLISDARHPGSTRLFAMCGRLLTGDAHTCGCLFELGWPSLVTRHPRMSGCSSSLIPIDLNTHTHTHKSTSISLSYNDIRYADSEKVNSVFFEYSLQFKTYFIHYKAYSKQLNIVYLFHVYLYLVGPLI